jgi:hypothetical protein
VIRIDFDGEPGKLRFFKEASRANAAVTSRASSSGEASEVAPDATAAESIRWLKVKSGKR